ncbi:cycloartenol synthase [Fistulifera solaris]|uniref:Cycloartenol synthase n=1 Tax=Fistulifera solaris TaxID=1519565 RepID=A0A1Z5JT99_FISSO|nr:cycloartenol synthase [Fistulifera solaris]|eukprot:GAX17250.1 cycloartenol synthase [Fistulifera solaris]
MIFFVLGCTIAVAALIQASISQGLPLEQLGVRSRGRGLLSWFYHYCVDGVGVAGYDPILGAFSPPLRVLFHISFVLMLWAVVISTYDSLQREFGIRWEFPGMKSEISLSLFLLSLSIYLFFLFLTQYFLPAVSDPGGPRPHRIQRQPQWENRPIPLPESMKQWRCVIAEESHAITEEAFGESLLTGEPFGRDMWTQEPYKSKLKAVDEKLVHELASGGRSDSFNPSVNPNSADIPYRAQLIREYLAAGNSPPSLKKEPQSVQAALRKAVHYYSMLQRDDGHWGGDYGGPHFLMPGLVVAWYIMGKPKSMLDDESIELMKHYIRCHQQSDGGWGTHLESPSTQFGSVLMYLALRLMGADKEDPTCQKGLHFIRLHGGALMTASWAKFYLCLAGCMHWDGHNSVPPEMWLLPNWFPFHPGRMWCHARMVYLPMGYLYGSRYVYTEAETDTLIKDLRQELYIQPYESIDWIKTRHMVAPMDNYSPISKLMETAQNLLARYETWTVFQPLKNLVRPRGIKFCAEYMAAEDLQTNFIDIGPVNKVLNMISAYDVANGNLEDHNVKRHIARVADYMWVAEDGMKMKGYNGSQCWDTSFAVQGIYEAGLMDEFPDVSKRVWAYLERCQILSTETSMATEAYKYESAAYRARFYRHISKGGWPFSTSAHGWPISDCTGEGLKGVLCLLKSKAVLEGIENGTLKAISTRRLEDAANILLTYQNEDGGFATYENNRGFGWYEDLNPSEVFGSIMIDYSYCECSMASLTALVEFHETFPDHRSDEICHAIDKGRDFLKSLQRPDGSWYGSWACCFCYGVWFGIEGLVKCGEPKTSQSVKKACQFLLHHQRPNGGWGEDFTSCYDKDYAANGMEVYGDDGSGVVNTAWALLALSAAECDDMEAIRKGVRYLMKRQLPCGDWPQEGIAGVFNRACGITYTAYRNVFPIWALGRCKATYGTLLADTA